LKGEREERRERREERREKRREGESRGEKGKTCKYEVWGAYIFN